MPGNEPSCDSESTRVESPHEAPGDRFGEEMAEDARVWKVYFHEASRFDEQNLRSWNGSLDTLLIFAGLFSAVSTAFIVESYKLMQPDYTQLTYRALARNFSGEAQPSSNSFEVPGEARTINCLWISSLITSLFAALLSILAKQWLALFSLPVGDSLRDWAKLRQFRYDGLVSWRVPGIIASLPTLLHVSLLLFLAGMVLFLRLLDPVTTVLALTLTSCIYVLYVATSLSPLLWADSPFRTHFTGLMERFVHHFQAIAPSRRHRATNSTDDTSPLDDAHILGKALSWLGTAVVSRGAFHAVLSALGDMSMAPQVASHIRKRLLVRIMSEMGRFPAHAVGTDCALRYARALLHLKLDASYVSRWVDRRREPDELVKLKENYALSLVTRDISADDKTLSHCFLAQVTCRDQAALLTALQPTLGHPLSPHTQSLVMSTLCSLKVEGSGTLRQTHRLGHLLNLAHAWRTYFLAHPQDISRLLNVAVGDAACEYRPSAPSGGDYCNILESLATCLVGGMIRPVLREQVLEDLLWFCKAHTGACSHPFHTSIRQLLSQMTNFLVRDWSARELLLIVRHAWPEQDDLPMGPQKAALTANGVITLLQPHLAWHVSPQADDEDQALILQTCRRCILRCIPTSDEETLYTIISGLKPLSILATSNAWLSSFIRAISHSLHAQYVRRDKTAPHDTVYQLIRVLTSSDAASTISRTSGPSDSAYVWDFPLLCAKIICRGRDLSHALDVVNALRVLQSISAANPMWKKLASVIHRDCTARRRPESLLRRAVRMGPKYEARAKRLQEELCVAVSKYNEAVGYEEGEDTALPASASRPGTIAVSSQDRTDRMKALHAALNLPIPSGLSTAHDRPSLLESSDSVSSRLSGLDLAGTYNAKRRAVRRISTKMDGTRDNPSSRRAVELLKALDLA